MTSGSPDNRPDRINRARLLLKISVSLATAALAYLVTNYLTEVFDIRELTGLTLSIVIGGVTLIIQFLIEFGDRFATVEAAHERHAQHIEELVRAGFSKINEATELFGLVDESALRSDAIQLVRHSTQIDPAAPPLFFRFAQHEITRMSEFIKELSEGGNVTYEGEDRDWMLALARNARSSIDATSLSTVDAGGRGFVDDGLWSSDLGQRYLEVQREAIRNGVRIRRVFILDRPDLAQDPDLRNACQIQRELGIAVRVLDASAIPGMRRTSLFDFILFDEVISYEVTPAARIDGDIRPAIVNTRLELRPLRVRDRIQRFTDLWESAKEADIP
ncbi:MAG: phosphatidylserine/phosphatidylglycerophosphate/cardiolipin synthase family protein [Micromonosporaceae bacterium]|nr:phosphatidylserine/phosphatidylglycerophosphate/cardiolipin synthase family protein [Micromonosporaceae bacterium]